MLLSIACTALQSNIINGLPANTLLLPGIAIWPLPLPAEGGPASQLLQSMLQLQHECVPSLRDFLAPHDWLGRGPYMKAVSLGPLSPKTAELSCYATQPAINMKGKALYQCQLGSAAALSGTRSTDGPLLYPSSCKAVRSGSLSGLLFLVCGAGASSASSSDSSSDNPSRLSRNLRPKPRSKHTVLQGARVRSHR